MLVITTFVALVSPGLSKSYFDEEGSAADSNTTFGASVVSLLCYEFRAMYKVIQKRLAGLYRLQNWEIDYMKSFL